jgi:hypothetical protein
VKREGPFVDPTSAVLTVTRNIRSNDTSTSITVSDDSVLSCSADPDSVFKANKPAKTLNNIPAPVTLGGAQSTLVAPLELREKVDFGSTNLVSRMFESWGEVPVALLQHVDWRNSLYGYIGIEDRTLYPMLRPGSFVQIDSQQTKVQPEGWHDEFERPI